MAKKKKADKIQEKPEELKGFDIHIDPFGNISSNMGIDKVNKYLDHHVDDKKFKQTSEEE